MKREKVVITKEDARNYAYEDLNGEEDFEFVLKRFIETTRWSILYQLIIKRKSDGLFFADTYRVGATEEQDEDPWEYDEPDFTQVFPKERTVISYV